MNPPKNSPKKDSKRYADAKVQQEASKWNGAD